MLNDDSENESLHMWTCFGEVGAGYFSLVCCMCTVCTVCPGLLLFYLVSLVDYGL